jgi:hypothetical protein
VFLQNYQAPGIFGNNELFFYRKFDGIGPWSIDRVHDDRSTSPQTLIKWESSAYESMAHIKTREGVSDNLIVPVNARMNGSRRLGQRGRRDRGGTPVPWWRLAGVSRYRRSGSPKLTRSSPMTSWRHVDIDLLTLGWRWWGDSVSFGPRDRQYPVLLRWRWRHQRGRRSLEILPGRLIWHGWWYIGATVS